MIKYLLLCIFMTVGCIAGAQDTLRHNSVIKHTVHATPRKEARERKKARHLTRKEKERLATKKKLVNRTLKEKNFHLPDAAKHK